MNIVIAPDSFKGSLSALEVANAIEKGVEKVDDTISVKKIPVADGGEGTVEALVTATGGKIIRLKVTGPLMEPVDSFFGILGDGTTAVVEMAAAAGITLVPESKRNPLLTTTFGVGELIAAAMDYPGCRRIIIGLGGSATNDGGMGMAQALGARFYDKEGKIPGQGGRYLNQVASIDISGLNAKLKTTEIIVACDVTNPLCGEKGASRVFGPQKGATPEMVDTLDKGLSHYATIIETLLSRPIASIPGSGAAGGLGAGMLAFCNASMRPGIEIVIQYCEAEKWIKNADVVITGEGNTDFQTAFGKVPVGIARVASHYQVPVLCLSGGLGKGFEETYSHGIDAAFSIFPCAMTLKDAMDNTEELLIQRTVALVRLIKKVMAKAKG